MYIIEFNRFKQTCYYIINYNTKLKYLEINTKIILNKVKNNAKKIRHAQRLNEAADAMFNGTYSPVWKNIEEPNEW